MTKFNCKFRNRLLHGLLFLLPFGSLPILAVNNSEDDVVTLDARKSRFEYRPGEVIVKFKDSSGVNVSRKNGKFHSASNSAVDQIFRSIGVEDMEPLMPLSGSTGVGRKMKAYNGNEVVAQDLSKLFMVKIARTPEEFVNIHDIIEQLQALDEVEFAEPNYIMHTLGGEIIETPDDPLYNVQYGISAIKLDKLWAMPVISKEGPIIAILDTGVEIDHPDLQDNIWTNEKEESGSEGYDDDGNGFKDDIHGWDFVNNTGEIYDYNGHGTHCAGIAAACGFNGKGIIGANPDARIMPVTVMQSNGTGDIATIIKGVDYAAANGAHIISMSIGGYASSQAYEQALGKAYQTAVIVAAAGNDGYCLNHGHLDRGQMGPMPMFPAAYTFVLGVQASSSNGNQASFSNYDDDGPVFSAYPEDQLYNYELAAPGVSITSTYPGGIYKALNGTSMATPLVAGALSRLLQTKEYNNWELLFGDLIHTVAPNGVLDIMATYNLKDNDRKPEIQIVGIDMVDEDGDGRPDAGETVEFYPTIRNAWGNVSNIRFTIDSAETVNNVLEIVEGEGELGHTLASYGKAKAEKPVKIKLNDNVADGRIIMLKLTASADGIEPIEQSFEIKAENAIELTGILKEDMTLTPDQHYVITGTFGVPEGRTLTIEPGTTVKFRDNSRMTVTGNIIANGEPGNTIKFTKADLSTGYISAINFGPNDLSYCEFYDFHIRPTNETNSIKARNFDYCIYRDVYTDSYTIAYSHWRHSSFYNLTGEVGLHGSEGSFEYSNVIGNNNRFQDTFMVHLGLFAPFSDLNSKINGNNIFNNTHSDYNGLSVFVNSNEVKFFTHPFPSYFGTGRVDIAKERVIDINHKLNGKVFQTLAEYDFSNMPDRPYAEAPGIVWKVEVNGKDAQDEFDDILPLGVGTHTFDVYFNRPMNTSTAPSISMGVRPPYTQLTIAEDGHWNDEGDIYTAKLTIKGNGDYDGLNRIYVDGALDNENFPIPPENMRFNVYVSAAGSLSDGFMATPGLGKVDLEWDSSDKEIDDVLGYNIYRYTVNGDGIPSDTTQINKRLIDDVKYTDFDVVPGTTYLYYYKTLRTNMSENSPSKVVAAKPLTASKGDANGSMSVDVADVVTEVNYIIGGNPQPFIFEAADVNSDEDINVLDIVGTINIINTPADGAGSNAMEDLSTACFSIEEGTLYVECDQPVGGLQVRLNADKSRTQISKAGEINGFEEVANWQSDNEYLYMLFSMTGKSLTPGKHALLTFNDAMLSEVIASNVYGNALPTEIKNGKTNVEFIQSSQDFKAYPNPATDIVNLDFVMPCDGKVFFVATNLQGALVDKCSRFSPAGQNTVAMNVSNLPAGVYFIQMIFDGKTINTYKVIKK